jgi:hypothetical protein
MAAVGSSSTRISASLRMNARASAIFCHWPPDSSLAVLEPLAELRVVARRLALDEFGGLSPCTAACRQRASSSKARSSPAPTFSPTSIW